MVMFPPVGSVFSDGTFWQAVASFASAIAAFAHQRAAASPHPADDLMDRFRRPLRWTLRHPIHAARVQVRRWRR